MLGKNETFLAGIGKYKPSRSCHYFPIPTDQIRQPMSSEVPASRLHSHGSEISGKTGRAGSWPVMLTPFDAELRIDWFALDALVDWYLAGGSQGLFASCLSSEMFHLAADERHALVHRIITRVAGRVPVIASGVFASDTTTGNATASPSALADSAHHMADTGAAAVIFLSNQFAAPTDSDAKLLSNLEATLARLDPNLPLGLYECPVPYKRILSPALTNWAARTGRFHFLKDTCCDLPQIKAKLAAIYGSPLRFYNANTTTLLPSLQAGGHGFSGVGANAIPHLYAWLCQHFADQPETARELQNFLITSAPAVDDHYPHSVKMYLHFNGQPISPVSRLAHNPLATDTAIMHDVQSRLQTFGRNVANWERRLGLTSPFAAMATTFT